MATPSPIVTAEKLQGLDALADELAAAGHGLIMVMGKGGVGKTTVAAALALELIQRGKSVHLSTTDPAAHLAGTLNGGVPGLTLSRIDPKLETPRYIAKIMAAGLAQRSDMLPRLTVSPIGHAELSKLVNKQATATAA